MKLTNNNISPLPFYDALSFQNHRKDYAFEQVYALITYKNTLLPFQAIVDTATDWFISSAKLINFNTGAEAYNVFASMTDNGLELKHFDDFSIIKYPGIEPIIPSNGGDIKEGMYYLQIGLSKIDSTADVHYIYSDVFVVTYRIDDYLILEYSNTYDLEFKNGIVDFSDGFKFKCYLNAEIGKPEYYFEEEVSERMGHSFVESQVSKKIYKFNFLAPEYLCDALRIVRLCDTKKITSKEQYYDLTTFAMSSEWQEQGDIASVDCEFETDTVIANIGGYALGSSPSMPGTEGFINGTIGGLLNVNSSVDEFTDEPVVLFKSAGRSNWSTKAVSSISGGPSYDDLYTLTIQRNGVEVGKYKPSADATINIDDIASALILSKHIDNANAHISENERTLWNLIAGLFGVDDDGDIYVKNGKGFYTNSFITAGGKGESSSGGGSTDYTQWGWDDIIQLTSDPGLGNLASAWALKQEYDSRQSALSILSQGLSSIRLLIPSSASESNQLADKEFVNSSIASNTATFRGTFEGASYLPSGAKLNDYAFVIATDASGNPEYNRYKYTASGWVFEYTLNNSSFTAEQWSAITSGITANLVSLYSGHIANQSNPHSVTKAQIGLGDVENIKLSSWAGSTNITTLGAVTTGEWKASKIANDYLVNSSIRIGSTTVALGGAIEALSGIASISLKGNNDAKLTYDNGAWHLSGNLLVDGYITAGGVGSSSGGGGIDSAAMWALLGDATSEQINKTHISSALEGYQTIIPDLATISSNAAYGNIAYGYFTNGKLPYTSVSGTPDLSDMATKTWVNVQGYLKGITSSMVTSALGYTPYNAANIGSASVAYATSAGSAPASDVYAWAKASTKPSYSFSEITSKPTTISGYGITDAYTASTIDSKLSGYLPLSGGTITGGWSVYTPLAIKSSNLSEVWINFSDTVGDCFIGSSNGVPSLYMGNHNQTIIHSGNYNSYAPTLTGIGASGTWGINISGNAATATKLATARTIWGQSFDGTGNVDGDILIGVAGSSSSRITSYGTLELEPTNGITKIGATNRYLIIDSYFSNEKVTSIYNIVGQPIYINANGSSTTPQICLATNGFVGIGTTSPSAKLHIDGNILATGAITAGTASDLRLKSNIATLVNASSVLRQLRGVGFDWNAIATDKSSYFKGHDVGLIAQEVEPLIPSAIGTIWGEYKRLDYSKITPYLVEGWKEHDNEIDRLRARVSELESEVNRLRNYVN